MSAGFALLCDKGGNLVKVLRDPLGILAEMRGSQNLSRLAARGSLGKMLSFLTGIKSEETVLDWEINVLIQGEPKLMYFTGSQVNDYLLVVADQDSRSASLNYQEIVQINNQQADELRILLKEQASLQEQDNLFNEISRLNNELVGMQRQLAKQNAELEQRVEARTRELVAIQEKLMRQEKLAALGELAGGIGHELRNPLGVINNSVYMLKMLQPNADERSRTYVDLIEEQVRRANKIISDLLDFGRLKSLTKEAIAVDKVVAAALDQFQVPGTVQVDIHIPTPLACIQADRTQVVQVLGNLITNACQAMEKGGRLTVSACQVEEMVAIAINDTGMGIAPEELPHLFEPLFSTKVNGIGLGLPISKKFVEANGGRIEVESIPGQGSTFTVFLPVCDENGATGGTSDETQ